MENRKHVDRVRQGGAFRRRVEGRRDQQVLVSKTEKSQLCLPDVANWAPRCKRSSTPYSQSISGERLAHDRCRGRQGRLGGGTGIHGGIGETVRFCGLSRRRGDCEHRDKHHEGRQASVQGFGLCSSGRMRFVGGAQSCRKRMDFSESPEGDVFHRYRAGGLLSF